MDKLPRYDQDNLQLSKIGCLFWLAITVFGLFVSSIVPTVQAQNGYPQPTNLYANDYANVLSPEDEANIGTLFAELNRDTGIEAVVVTINSIRDYDVTDETFETFATGLFNTWGIGDKQKNNGILILVAVQDQQVRIEVGSGYGSSQNATMQEIINQQMLPSFKQGNYSQGISQGTQAIASQFGGKREVTSTPPSSSNQVFAVLIIAGSLLFIIYLFRLRRRRSGYHYSGYHVDGGGHSSGDSFGGGSSSGEGASGHW